MKAKITILIFVTIITNIKAQWVEIANLEDSVNSGFSDIYLISENIGFILENEFIFRTIDGGNSWNLSYISPDPTSNFEDIDFYSEEIGIVTGIIHEGFFLQTFDKGITWNVAGDSESPPVDQIEFIDQDFFYLASDYSFFYCNEIIASCADIDFPPVTVFNIHDIEVIDYDTAYVAGLTTLVKTKDHGETWEVSFETGGTSSATEVEFPSPKVGYITQLFYYYKTEDYGKTWVEFFMPDYIIGCGGYFHFVNDSAGFMACDDGDVVYLMKTTNGGNDWEISIDPQYFGEDYGSLTGYHCINDTTCWALTSHGNVFYTTNGGEGGIVLLPPVNIDESIEISFSLSPNPSSSFIKINYQNSPDSYREGIKQIITTNYLGEKIEILFDENDHADISALPSGIYFTEIITDKNKGVQKWVKL